MAASVKNIQDVAENHLCTGCGVCAYLEPESIRMVDDLERGRRPVVDKASDQVAAMDACPGHSLEHPDAFAPGVLSELAPQWGPVLEVWEGFATDDELRHAASSGGAASALSIYGIEKGGLHGLLHIAARKDVPWLNQTVLSRSRAEILAATGSRYAPASPCDGLEMIEQAPAPSVFIGKPCDVAGAMRARTHRPGLDEKLALTIGIFCAGAPSTQATLDLIRESGIEDIDTVESVRYRGKGWPGMWRVQTSDGREESATYAESWGKLQRGRPWRCYVCADHTGEFADIAVGDPWYRDIPADEPGRSLILVRTERGRRFLEAARDAGYLHIERKGPEILVASQPNLLHTRGAIWGRILVTRLLGAAAPRYRNMPMFPSWLRELTWREKLGSILGTARRTFRKGLRKRVPVREWKSK